MKAADNVSGVVLHLTSPHMTGSHVKHLQELLHKHGYFDGTVDGVYGPLTGQAVYRAKFWIGYRKPDQTSGSTFVRFLDGKKKPTAAMKLLAAKRRHAKKHRQRKHGKHSTLTRGQRIVKVALGQLGETEHPPDSNRSKFSLWYGVIGAWCAMFVTWVCVTVGTAKRTFQKGIRYAYVPYIVDDARAGRNGLMLASGPADGNPVCFDWNKDGVADHVGISVTEETLRHLAPDELKRAISAYGPLGAGDFWTVEGNTAVGNDSNGGLVMIRKRNRVLVLAFVKVAA